MKRLIDKYFRATAVATATLLIYVTVFNFQLVFANTKSRNNSMQSIIKEELQSVLENSEEYELIPVNVWITPCNTDEIEELVKNEIGYNKADITAPFERQSFDVPIENEFTADQVDLYIETERRVYAERQEEHSLQFLSECSGINNLQISYDQGSLFCSKYAPLISVALTRDEIYQLTQIKQVEELNYCPDASIILASNVSIPLIRANYTRDTVNLTGNGVKIGQFEADEPDRTKPYFTSSNIFYDTSKPRNPSTNNHANNVAALMVAKSYGGYKGIVPDAQLYCVYGNTSSQWKERIEWLLSQGVNVINMSAGFDWEEGAYGDLEKWIDHIAINHSVHFVMAGGNNRPKIFNPGMAYNIITVGGMDDNNTLSHYDDSWNSGTCYVTNSGTTNKPDLVAPSRLITTAATTDSGSSTAAPHVTAVVAQLCQRVPSFKVMQNTVKSIITAGISHSILSYDSSSGTNFNKMGAGCVDAQGSYYIANTAKYVKSSFEANSSNGATRNYTFNVSASDTVTRVSLNWLKYSTISGTHTSGTPTLGTLADLDLKVYDKNGNLVKSSTSLFNNTEIVKFTPSTSLNPYKIEVKQVHNSDRKVYYTVSWY